MLLAHLLPRYEASLVGRKCRPRGVQRYMWILRLFVRSLGVDPEVQDITAAAIRRYQESMAARGASASTIGNALSTIRSFCRWAMEEGLRDDDPTVLRRWPRRERTAPRALHRCEIRALLRAIDEPETFSSQREQFTWRRNRLVILIMLYTGLRLAEVAELRWRDVDLEDRILLVRSGKGGKDRLVPIHIVVLRELRQIPYAWRKPGMPVVRQASGQPLKHKSVGNIFEYWLPRQGIDDVSAHRLRHTFASQLLASGADIKRIQELLGHNSLETTQRYLMIDPKWTRLAVDALPEEW